MREYHIYIQHTKCVEAHFNYIIYRWLPWEYDEHLEEGNTWGDTTWGTVNGIGENRLGRILMKVRKELQEESK